MFKLFSGCRYSKAHLKRCGHFCAWYQTYLLNPCFRSYCQWDHQNQQTGSGLSQQFRLFILIITKQFHDFIVANAECMYRKRGQNEEILEIKLQGWIRRKYRVFFNLVNFETLITSSVFMIFLFWKKIWKANYGRLLNI